MLVLLAALAGCGEGGGQGSDNAENADTLKTGTENGGGVLNVAGKMFSIPSPTTTAMLLRRSGAEYRADLMADAAKVDMLTSRVGQALAMGAFGADLAYATMNQDPVKGADMLKAIEVLREKLGLTHAFGPGLLERCRKNIDRQDSLLRLSGEAFRAADRYMKNDGSEDLSALVLTGGWIESLHLSADFARSDPNGEMAIQIGSEKNTLADLIAMLEAADREKACAALCGDLRTLQQAFAAIQMDYKYEEPVTDPQKRITYINSNTKVTITAEQIATIGEQVTALRNKYMI